MYIWMYIQLVGGLEHGFYFSRYWEFHHPNWRTHIFRGVGQPPSRQINNIICRGYPVAMSELQRVNHPFHTQLGYNGSLRDWTRGHWKELYYIYINRERDWCSHLPHECSGFSNSNLPNYSGSSQKKAFLYGTMWGPPVLSWLTKAPVTIVICVP